MTTPLAWVLDRAIRGYQLARAGRPSPCRHVPSCSVYGREAIAIHGGLKGGWLAVRRIGRCNPWGSSGLDPVPPARRSARSAPLPEPRCADS